MLPRTPEAPRWAWILIAVCVLAVALLLPRALDHGAVSPAAPAPSGSSVASRSDAGSPDSSEPAQILVVGDAYTAGSTDGGNGSAGWTELVMEELLASGTDVEATVAAAVGSGYLQEGATGMTFRELAASATATEPSAVVFFGSESDVASPDDVQAAVTMTYEEAQDRWPAARLLVIGPAWRDASPPDSLVDTSAAVAAAAAAVGASFVDPLTEGWFADEGQQLIGSEGYPTDAGHRVMAERIRPLLQRLLAVIPATEESDAGSAPR